jgi:hypothetical protein
MPMSLIVTDISLVSSGAMAVARPLADRIAAGETTQRTQQFLSAVEEAVRWSHIVGQLGDLFKVYSAV